MGIWKTLINVGPKELGALVGWTWTEVEQRVLKDYWPANEIQVTWHLHKEQVKQWHTIVRKRASDVGERARCARVTSALMKWSTPGTVVVITNFNIGTAGPGQITVKHHSIWFAKWTLIVFVLCKRLRCKEVVNVRQPLKLALNKAHLIDLTTIRLFFRHFEASRFLRIVPSHHTLPPQQYFWPTHKHQINWLHFTLSDFTFCVSLIEIN